METILKELVTITNANKQELNIDGIDLLIYISTLNDNINCNELECASKIVHHAITYTFENSEEIFLQLLRENDEHNFVTLSKNNHTFKVYVRSKWLFQVILLSATKYLNVLNGNTTINDNSIKFLHIIVTYITKYMFIRKQETVHLLRTLLFTLNRRRNIFSPQICSLILKHMNKVALSTIPYFKQYAHSISKIVLSILSNEQQKIFYNIEILPIKGIETIDIVKLFPRDFIRKHLKVIVKKVLTLFLHNVENKDGGILYESVLFYSFVEWKKYVWPLFLNSLTSLEYEGEFFQSLLKYWIPSNVTAYRSDFYAFLKQENVSKKLIAYVLLESRKRGFMDHIPFDDIKSTLYDIGTTNVGLKIVSVYHKKSLCPEVAEITVILNYLYSILNFVLLDEEVESLLLFFSQILLNAHAKLKKSKIHVLQYVNLLEKIFKYCFSCLETDHFEIAAQILLILTNISTGSYRCLKLYYKVEKRDMYEEGENLLYKELKINKMWKLDTQEFYDKLLKCFIRNDGIGTNLSKLLTLYADNINFFNVQHIRSILAANTMTTLQNTERVKNYMNILIKNKKLEGEISKFGIEILECLSDNLTLTKDNYSNENILYKNVLFFEIILMFTKNKFETFLLRDEIELAIDLVNYILENHFSGNSNYKTAKILEAFINNIMYCIIQNKDTLWPVTNKRKFINSLIRIIQCSNMKRPVSLATAVLKQLSTKMNETELDRVLRIQILEATLISVHRNPMKQELKIRRSPESRLVIHALCTSERNENKPLLNWVLNHLLDIVTNRESSDTTISSALHSIEILVSDNSLHPDTLPFIPDILRECIELFSKTSWIVRNADLQLAKALIERLYGVSLSLNARPKNVEHLFLLYPELSVYFFKILSLEKLDERSILVFQFFFESQIKEQMFKHDIVEISRQSFLVLFADIIKKYPNNYGNLAVRSYVSLCLAKEIPDIIVDVTNYVRSNFKIMKRNVFANFRFLLQELYEKYKQSFYYSKETNSFMKVNYALDNLLTCLRKHDTSLFNYLLFKVKSVDSVLKDFESLNTCNDCDFNKRLWMHNNLPFVIINAKANRVSDILNKILSNRLMGCMQIKIISILVQRLENDDFNCEDLTNILSILFAKSFVLDDSNNYVLNCYYKIILLFLNKVESSIVTNLSTLTVSSCYNTNNLYKIMIYVLYFSKQKCDQKNFYKIVETVYRNSIGINEETDNDIMSTLRYFKMGAPKSFSSTIFKLAFYGAIYSSTHLEAYNFMAWIMGKTYDGVLSALADFLRKENLMKHLEQEEIVKKFLIDIFTFVNSLPKCCENNSGYYSIESDFSVSKSFLTKLLNTCLHEFLK